MHAKEKMADEDERNCLMFSHFKICRLVLFPQPDRVWAYNMNPNERPEIEIWLVTSDERPHQLVKPRSLIMCSMDALIVEARALIALMCTGYFR
jgi:hypothetical protein